MRSAKVGPWVMGLGIAALLTVVPYVYYRHCYTYGKRLRPVVEGRVYRSGCLTADGFRDAIRKYQIRTVLNLMEENRDPALPASYFDSRRTRESELCASLGARMEFLFVDTVPAPRVGTDRPETIDRFLELMDDERNYPVLIHCKAGLHRTGCLAALYRMEYQGWGRLEAWRELRAHGFGEFYSTADNDYVTQYVLAYAPGRRRGGRPAPPHARPAANRAPFVLTSTPTAATNR